jgi:proteasome lid subunit RPN8/RPN11
MRKHILAAVQAHAAAEYPRECCGLLLQIGRKQVYHQCTNAAKDPTEEFRIAPEQYAEGRNCALAPRRHQQAVTARPGYV